MFYRVKCWKAGGFFWSWEVFRRGKTPIIMLLKNSCNQSMAALRGFRIQEGLKDPKRRTLSCFTELNAGKLDVSSGAGESFGEVQ